MSSTHIMLPEHENRSAGFQGSPVLDLVAEVNAMVLGLAPSMAVGTSYLTMAHATGTMLMNSAASQQQQAVLSLAQTAQGFAKQARGRGRKFK